MERELHQKLAEISKKCHQLKLEGQTPAPKQSSVRGREKEIEKLEKENDELVRSLFCIKDLIKK